ncbi:LysE family translocator [Caballeronia sp. AZ10_KS36]|uniref:LysE family translocator n=1 Tax=Caballeronia sp. AZ10_KS36 TaxID=2921757 RepID=UPI00202790BF|nr:LysE family translocator [Caballeronia sp. AZ10_KS36]
MSIQTFSLFVPACFAINMAFGPNNMLSLSNGARRGVRVSVLASFGRLAAFAVMIAIAGLGLGALLLASETLFTAIKLVGAAYLVWIGIKLIRSGPQTITGEEGAGAAGLARLTKQEFLVAAGNPKAILVFTAFFPQFVDRSAYAASFAILGAIFLLFELVAIVIYAALGARLGSLSRGARGFRWFNRVSGALMIGFGVMLALVRRPAA